MRSPACLPLRPALALLLGLLFVSSAHAGTYAWRTTDSGGNTTALSPTFSGGQWYYGYGDPTVPVPYGWGDYGSGGGTGTGNSSGQVNSTGTVTVIFTWQPGYAGEPAPPALITQTCDAYWYCSAPAPPAASCSNGLGDPEIDASSGQSYRGESRGTHYSVVSPDANGTVTVTLTGAQAHVPLSSSGLYGSNVRYDVDAYPIVISSPDPLGRPDLGDGKNQFVYSADTPDGYLYVPGALQAVGAGSAEANWLIGNSPIVGPLDKVNLTIDSSVIPNTFTHQWAVSGGTIYVNTPQDVNNPYPGYQFNHWIFKGLPSDNSGFGNHTVNLLVQGAKTQTAKIQTFFKGGSVGNFPGRDPQWQVSNWYHYYNQIHPSPDDPNDGTDAAYNPSLSTHYGECYFTVPPNYDPSVMWPYADWTTEINIGPPAGGVMTASVFDVGSNGYVRHIGDLYLRGILTYIWTCEHEEAHRTLFGMGITYPWNTNNGGAPPNGFIDTDVDGVSDTWELSHHLNPRVSDTTNSYPQYATSLSGSVDGGDEECLCDILALKATKQQASMVAQDWSDAGWQYGAGSPLYYTPPKFTWQFSAAVDGATFAAGTIHNVTSINDPTDPTSLVKQYPTLLTDLP